MIPIPDHMIPLAPHTDPRGKLLCAECGKEIPFEVKRVFFISDVPAGAVRGEHAYKHNEFAVCAAGSCTVELSDGVTARTVRLCEANRGLLIPAGCWRTLRDFSPDCVLTVLSDAFFSEDDYIFDREAFLRAAREDV